MRGLDRSNITALRKTGGRYSCVQWNNLFNSGLQWDDDKALLRSKQTNKTQTSFTCYSWYSKYDKVFMLPELEVTKGSSIHLAKGDINNITSCNLHNTFKRNYITGPITPYTLSRSINLLNLDSKSKIYIETRKTAAGSKHKGNDFHYLNIRSDGFGAYTSR